MPRKWFYFKDGKQLGPYTWKQLYIEAYNGNIEPADLVWVEGLSGWIKAELVDNLIPSGKVKQKTEVTGKAAKITPAAINPQSLNDIDQKQAKSWYMARSGQTYGPYSSEQILSWVKEGRLKKDDLVCNEIMTQWAKAGTVKGLFPLN